MREVLTIAELNAVRDFLNVAQEDIAFRNRAGITWTLGHAECGAVNGGCIDDCSDLRMSAIDRLMVGGCAAWDLALLACAFRDKDEIFKLRCTAVKEVGRNQERVVV